MSRDMVRTKRCKQTETRRLQPTPAQCARRQGMPPKKTTNGAKTLTMD